MRVFQDPVTGSYWREDGKPGFTCPVCHNGYADLEDINPDVHGCLGVEVAAGADVEAAEGCSHEETEAEAEGRVCSDCRQPLDLTPGQELGLRMRDDEVYDVSSLDGSTIHVGPFDSWEQANDAAEQFERDNPFETTDVTMRRLGFDEVAALLGEFGMAALGQQTVSQ